MIQQKTLDNNSDLSEFKIAQSLYSFYKTLQRDEELYNMLCDLMGTQLNSAYNKSNIREYYNNIILKNYPNEIAVKANFINNVLIKTSNHVTIFEMNVGNSRVDLCKINGTSTAYEIKTDLDNLNRLAKQLNDYSEIFEKVFVICSSNKCSEIEKHITENCGIYTYTITKKGNFKFKLYKKALLSKGMDSKKQLSLLRKQELLSICNLSSELNRNKIIDEILRVNMNRKINNLFKKIIKERYFNQWDFFVNNMQDIYEIDYQWFFRNTINPKLVYY